jgi:hypothetical protein
MCPRAGVGRKTMQTKGTGAVHCLLLGTLLLGGSCAGPSVPRSAVQAPWGIVRAPEARRAGEVSGVMARLVSAVALESGVQDPPPVEIWQLSHEIEGPLVANTRPGRIELGAEVGTLLGDEDGLTWLLAHEYAHWCLHSAEERQWDALPTLLAEGLAEAIVLRALPHLARSAWAEHRAALESIERIESGQTLFNLTLEEWAGSELRSRRACCMPSAPCWLPGSAGRVWPNCASGPAARLSKPFPARGSSPGLKWSRAYQPKASAASEGEAGEEEHLERGTR